MQQTRYEMIVRCQDAVSHSSGTIGNQSLFMRKGVRLPGGKYVQVPYLTGDAIRHQLRAAATWGTLHLAGLHTDPDLTEGAARLLFNGGSLTKKGSGTVINLDRYRQLVALFPPLALFGGNTDNRSLKGQVNVDEGNVLCTEMEHLTPPWVLEWLKEHGEEMTSRRAVIEEVQRVRMDELQNPEVLQLLAPESRANVLARQLKAETAHEKGDSKEAREAKSGMMPRTHERLKQGTLLWLGIEARTYTDLEFDAFNFTIACLLNNFRFGGKIAQGHGRLTFVAGARCHFAPTAGTFEPVGTDLAPKVGELYKAHVEAKREDLRAWVTSAINS